MFRSRDPHSEEYGHGPFAALLEGRQVHVWKAVTLASVPITLTVFALWMAGLLPGVPRLVEILNPPVQLDAASAARIDQIARMRLERDAYLAFPVSGEGSVRTDLTPEEAMAVNASMPVSTLPNPRAAAFMLTAETAERQAAIECMTAAVYYEAAVESDSGQRAVAQVVINRVRHPAYPKTICGVVYEGSQLRTGCQFTFTCDGSLAKTPVPALWARARSTAVAALSGSVMPAVGLSTQYHADYVVPYWASRLVKVTKVGAHIFYRWPGGWGLPAAFTQPYGAAGAPSNEEAAPAAAPLADPSPLPPLPPPPAAETVAPPPEPAAAPVAARAPETPAVVKAEPAPAATPSPPPPKAPPAKSSPARPPRIAAPSGW